MKLKRIQVVTPQVGLLTNSYVVCDDETKEAIEAMPLVKPFAKGIYFSNSLSCRPYWRSF